MPKGDGTNPAAVPAAVQIALALSSGAMMRKPDGTDGWRRRRATISHQEEDARKRELCAGG